MLSSHWKIFLGSIPGHLNEAALAACLRPQVYSFVKVETTKSHSRDKMVKNNGFAFMTVSDHQEYSLLIDGHKKLRVEDRNLRAKPYKDGPALEEDQKSAPFKKIYIGSVPNWFTDAILEGLLNSAGLHPIIAFCAQQSSSSVKFSFGFAEFTDSEQANIALQMAKIEIPGLPDKYITLERYKIQGNSVSAGERSPTSQDSRRLEHQQPNTPSQDNAQVEFRRYHSDHSEQGLMYNNQEYCIFDKRNYTAPESPVLVGPGSSLNIVHYQHNSNDSRSADLKVESRFHNGSSLAPQHHRFGFSVDDPSAKAGLIMASGGQRNLRTPLHIKMIPADPKLDGNRSKDRNHQKNFHLRENLPIRKGPVIDRYTYAEESVLACDRIRKLSAEAHDFISRESEAENCTKSWLASVKSSVRQSSFDSDGSNLRFNISVSSSK
jgi:hypothetical protein